MQILYSYLRYTDRFLNVFFLLLVVILLELPENPRRKDWVTEEKYIEEIVWRSSPFWLYAYFLMPFLSLFCLLPPYFQVTHLLNGPYKDTFQYCSIRIPKICQIWVITPDCIQWTPQRFLLFIAENIFSLVAFVAGKVLLVSQHLIATFYKICSY